MSEQSENQAESIVHNWRERLEDLLKSKNLDELKSEFKKIGSDLQTEIQSFDLNAHLSPTAKARVKQVESRYNEVLQTVQKAQKQFDREFNKALKVMKSTQKDAEKRLELIRKKLAQQKSELTKKALKVKKNFTKKAARKKSPRKAKKA